MMKIRRANTCDLDWVLGQLRQFDDFYGTKKKLFPENDELALGFMTDLLMKQPVYVAEIAGSGDAHGHDAFLLVGFIAGVLAPHPYNPEIVVLSEMFWWVDPEHRGSSAAARLLEMFLAFGRLHADWIVMTLEAKSPVDPRSLERKGFHLHESSFLLEVA